jgi:hypothetical protein
MAEDRTDSRETTWRTLFPWTELFRGFSLALDPNKLFLAALGILAMAIAWSVLAWFFGTSGLFYPALPYDFQQDYVNKNPNAKPEELWPKFKHDRRQLNLMHRATGMGGGKTKDGVATAPKNELVDLVGTYRDFATLEAEYKRYIDNRGKDPKDVKDPMPPTPLQTDEEIFAWIISRPDVKLDEDKDLLSRSIRARLGKDKESAELNTLPWSEKRGPNPFLLATGQLGRPWEAGHFWDWFLTEQLPVVIEPLRKLVLPLLFFFSPDATGLPALYFFLVFAATVAIWSLVGGAITRIAAVQVARGEKLDFMEAVRFTLKRWASYIMAPVYPLAFVIVLIIVAMIFGLLHMIPFIGDIFVSGLFWPFPLLIGFVIALTIICLVVGWPLMPPTISTEGTDSWEALSRSFSYVLQKPFHYLWYAVVAICYGAVLIFFVVFVGSFAVYLSKWAVSQTPRVTTATSRDPVYLFVYAPESFHWRELLLRDKLVDGEPLVVEDHVNPDAYDKYLGLNGKQPADPSEMLRGWNKVGAVMVAFWLYLVFLLIIGFGYSLFWSLITVIYFLLRRDVDAAEFDEVYLEEDEHDLAYGGPLTPPTPPPAKSDQPPLTMVESPTLRGPSATPPPPAPPPEAAPPPQAPPQTEPVKPATTDGNPPPA